MNLSLLATRAIGSAELFLKKNAPTILTGAGVAGFIATTALTIRATTKANDALPKISANVAEAKARVDNDDFSEKEKARALTRVYAESSLELARIYWPVVVVGSGSIVCVLAGHGMMLRRHANLLAAYTLLDASYKAYRKRVRTAVGDERELELYRGARLVEGCDEEGQPCEIIDMDDVMPSSYSKFFDETSRNWSKTPEYNLLFLRSQQDWANDRLRAYGHIFLNEVYDALGLERTQAGQVVGWKEDAARKGTGDGYVDFGLYKIGDECNRAFVNGLEHTVLLDFNVDGPILI